MFEEILGFYAVIGIILLGCGMLIYYAQGVSDEDRSKGARIILSSFIWPLALVFFLCQETRKIWRDAWKI